MRLIISEAYCAILAHRDEPTESIELCWGYYLCSLFVEQLICNVYRNHRQHTDVTESGGAYMKVIGTPMDTA